MPLPGNVRVKIAVLYDAVRMNGRPFTVLYADNPARLSLTEVNGTGFLRVCYKDNTVNQNDVTVFIPLSRVVNLIVEE